MIDSLSMQTDGFRCPYWVPSRDARCGSTNMVDGRNRRRLSDSNIARVNELASQIASLRDRIARAETLNGEAS